MIKKELPFIEVKDIVIQRGSKTVLQVPFLSIQHQERLTIIGPNGAGKSTLLLVISQLLAASQGQVIVEGKPLKSHQERQAFRRKIGLVLQEPLLLDASVLDNAACGLYFRGMSRKEAAPIVEAWLEKLDILSLRNRHAYSLSGGEARRVSLARALAIQPQILLLDEPFNALDSPTRLRLLEDYQSLLALTKITTLFVTHDLDEAVMMGQRVAVIMHGQIRQIASPQEVFNAPIDTDVANFVGADTIIPAQITGRKEGLLLCEVNNTTLEAIGEVDVGRKVFLCLRPEDITLWKEEQGVNSSARNSIVGSIMRLVPQGALFRVVLECGFPLNALITRASAIEMGLNVGDMVIAKFKASAVHILPR